MLVNIGVTWIHTSIKVANTYIHISLQKLMLTIVLGLNEMNAKNTFLGQNA